MEKRTIYSIVLGTLCILNTNAQKKKDREAIKSMCGCYKVAFNFAETFNYSKDANYKPSKVKQVSAKEWVQLVEDDKNKIAMQHLLIVGAKDKQHVIKHWRQDWLYQNTSFHQFNGDNFWKHTQLSKKEVKGQWTQKVFQVDDSPRYEGSATWVHVDGTSKWENKTNAPLPRREYTQRYDYNITERTNKHEITNTGWLHDQDNKKIIRKKGVKDFILAEEKGYNTYLKIADSECKKAQEWWSENGEHWKKVRNEWEYIFNAKKDLKLAKKVNDKFLYETLFDASFNFTSKNIHDVLHQYIVK